MRFIVLRTAALLMLGLAATGNAIADSGRGFGFTGRDFEELRTTLLEAEPKALCGAVRQEGWKGLTLELTLRAASSQEEAMVKANAAGLLRGFVALLLDGKSCAEPPEEVLAESQEYSRRFGTP